MLKKFKQSIVYAFDPSPISITWINNKNTTKLFFNPFGISDKKGDEVMYFPKDFEVSYGVIRWDKDNKDQIKVPMETIENFADEKGRSFTDILKMDIEGSEFKVLKSIDYSNIKFGQILVEFHKRFFSIGNQLLKETIAILNENGYECFAISDDYEYSFINTSLFPN